MLTAKQKLYYEILEMLLPALRNIQQHPAWRRIAYGAFYPEMELVHNLHRILIIPEFTEYDVHWLNSQARIFVERGKNPAHGCYKPIASKISEVFRLVPEDLRQKLTWSPECCRTALTRQSDLSWILKTW